MKTLRKVMIRVGIAVVLLILAFIVFKLEYPRSDQWMRASIASNGSLPDTVLTPGAVRPDATKEQVCSTSTKEFRNVPNSLKEDVRRRYGMHGKRDLWCNTAQGCEIDHLVALTIGGSNEITNLWPQPYEGEWNAHMKDKLEDKLHFMVCDGSISIQDAQNAISKNWIEAYKRYVDQ